MDSDDTTIGRLLSRREMLTLFGASGAMVATGGVLAWPGRRSAPRHLPSCVVRPEQTEGPYFVDEKLTRSDIRTDPATGIARPGTPFALNFLVARVTANGCEPLQNALVDIWHCDADGVYSDVSDPNFSTVGQKFLRGNQSTDRLGRARFQTIYPGWYPGRAVHIHFKIRSAAAGSRSAEFTSQVYFDERLTDQVHTISPYNRKGSGRTRNTTDRIFANGGDQLLLAPTAVATGFEATFEVGLQLG